MAITWTLRVSKLGGDSYAISATVNDDTKPAGHQDESVSVASGKLDTPEHKKQVWDELHRQYLEKTAASVDLSTLESEGKTDLEAR